MLTQTSVAIRDTDAVSKSPCSLFLLLYTNQSNLFILLVQGFHGKLFKIKDERPLLKAAIDEGKVLCLGKSWYRRLDKIVSFFKFNIYYKLSDCLCVGLCVGD